MLFLISQTKDVKVYYYKNVEGLDMPKIRCYKTYKSLPFHPLFP